MLQTTRTWISRISLHPNTLSLACGAAAGTAWVTMCASYWTAFEPVPTARMTFAFAWSLTLALMWLPRVTAWMSAVPHFWRVGAASCGMALWPMLYKAVLTRREIIPLEWYAGEWTSLAAMAIPAVLILMPLIALGVLLCPAPSTAADGQPRNPQAFFWLGVAICWCVLPTTLFVRVSADRVLSGLSGGLLVGAGLSLFLKGATTERSSLQTFVRQPIPETSRSSGVGLGVISLVCAFMIGVLLEVGNRSAEQIILESLSFKLFGWAGFLAGLADCAGWQWPNIDRKANLRNSLLLIALAAAAVLALFPVWIRLGLWSSANLSALPSIILVKGFIPFGILFPVGFASGSQLRHVSSRSLFALVIGAGYVVATAAPWPMTGTLVSLTCVAVGLNLALWPGDHWRVLTARRGRNRRIAALGACAGLIAVALGCRNWLDPVRSTRLLFNGDAFSAAANGYDLDTIERADRSRWLKTIEGQNGVWTVWRPRANQLALRRNGLPVGQMSLDTGRAPQNFWSVMTPAVPLVLHPQADDVLCLGNTGLVEINTLLGFPVHSLTCVEADHEVRSLIEYEATLSVIPSRLQDGRLRWVKATPMQFATSTTDRKYDVVVCPEQTSVPLRSQPQFTQEFHAGVAGHLNPGGIFCQRMNITDYGATPMLDTLQSLQSVFVQTCIITTDGSEVLLLATNSPDPIFESSLISRLDTSHVRQLCATLGSDWSTLTQLTCVKPEGVQQLLAGYSGTPNTCQSARFTMSLPSETLRWGPKWKEKQAVFADRTDLILMAMGLEDEALQEVVRRIQDTQERTRIVAEEADDQWSYRGVLKAALKERPRTTIKRVNHQIKQTLSREDKHRKDYLVALGQAARQPSPSLQSIETLEKFVEPYDPLLTDFVYFEVAHLLNRASEPDPAREYQTWIHFIAFGPNTDKSVLPVATALNLLRQNPGIVPDPAQRWDEFSSLLDVMRIRWANRWQAPRPSQFEPSDMQHSMEAVTATLSKMDDLVTEAGLTRETWKVQRRIWEDSLVTPTRTRQEVEQPKNQMLESVRQAWVRRNRELAEPK